MSNRLHRPGVLLALLGLARSAVAATADQILYPASSPQASPVVPGVGSGGGLTFVAVVLLAGAGAWVLWRGRGKRAPGKENPQLAIAETRSLGNRQYLVVASYEGKKFLLGVCPGRIDLLAPLDSPTNREKSP